MDNYKRMYLTLFHATTDAIRLLQEAQRAAEEIYISGSDSVIEIVRDFRVDEKNSDQS